MTFFAAMPVLFFVAGVLLAASSERASHRALLLSRGRRLLLPVWLYGAVVLLGGAAHAYLRGDVAAGAALPLGDAATWLIPLVDPRSSVVPHGWLTTHLWYIRAYLWVLVLTPLFLRLARRLRLGLAMLGAALVAVLVAGRLGIPMLGSGPAHVVLGDAVVYGTFVVLGMAYHHGRLRRLGRRPMLGALFVLVAGIGVYVWRGGVPAGGVNDSYPLTLLTGLAWLLLVAALESPIRKLACVGSLRRVTSAVNRRAVTIYLWHPAAIVIGYWTRRPPRDPGPLGPARRRHGRHGHRGPDRRRRPRRRLGGGPRRQPAATPETATGLACTRVAGSDRPRRRARPGGAAPHAGADSPRVASRRIERFSPPATVLPTGIDGRELRRESAQVANGGLRLPAGSSNDVLQATLDRWLEGRPDVGSVAVAVATGGDVWAGDAHHPETLSPTRAGDSYGIASVTKTFTLALTLMAVDQGRITLDAPVPAVPEVGHPPEVRSSPRASSCNTRQAWWITPAPGATTVPWV